MGHFSDPVYLEPRVEAKRFLSAVQPIVNDQYKSSTRIKVLFEAAHEKRVGFYDPAQRQELIKGFDDLSHELRKYKALTAENIKKVEAVEASKETAPVKNDLLATLRDSRASTAILFDNIDYMKSLVVVVDRYNPQLKDIRQKSAGHANGSDHTAGPIVRPDDKF